MISKAEYIGSPYIGIFCVANDEIALVPEACPRAFESELHKVLDVDVIKTSMARTSLLGIFSVLNNKRVIVPNILEKEELKTLRDVFSEVLVLEERYTALGNLIAMNDHGILCTDAIASHLEGAVSFKIAGSDLVGSSIFVNNKGFLAHREASDTDLKKIEKVFKVNGDVGTVNFGDPLVKSGIVGNRQGVVIGALTSGPELNRIDEIFILE